MSVRLSVLAAIFASGISSAVAENVCTQIMLDAEPDFSDHELYFRPEPIRGDKNPKWQRAIPNNGLINSETPRGRKTKFAYVSYPLNSRSGAVNIRVRTEAIGLVNDTRAVRISRSRIAEKCGYFGGTTTRKEYSNDVSTLAYEEFHQIGKSSTAIDKFHFEYRNDDNRCVRTDAAERRAAFRFSVPEAGYIRAVHVDGLSNANGLVQDIVYGLTQVATTPLKLLSTTANAAINPNTDLTGSVERDIGPKYFSQLQSYLMKYNARANSADCMTFSVQTHDEDRTTYVSVTDLDENSSKTWKINWIAR